MGEAVNPINITGAALITQLSLIMVMFIGTLMLKESYIPFSRQNYKWHTLAWIILTLALITLGCLLFSDEFSTIWKPLFGNTSLPVIKWASALFIMFSMNIVCVALLISRTGGLRNSSFSPIYFILPALAIFLREPIERIVIYTLFISMFFTWNLVRYLWSHDTDEVPQASLAYWFVAIACLMLATYIGYITRS